jgi:hypothetical protein
MEETIVKRDFELQSTGPQGFVAHRIYTYVGERREQQEH